jgi:hypothetical protein
MVGYMSLEEQADANFSRARRTAFLRRISARLRKGPTPNHLACFEEVSNKVGAVGGIRRGRRTVRLADIVGSVSRCSEFDRSFFPLWESARTKWKHMDRAFHRGEELPPVSLYKIDEYYFVLDGNHRVSVYRYHGVEWIDADVTEFRAPVEGPEGQTLYDPSPPDDRNERSRADVKPKDLLALILPGALWGGSFLFIRVGTPVLGSLVLMELRVGVAATVLAHYCFLRKSVSPM